MTTHRQLLYHIVFSTKNRKNYLAKKPFREEVFAFMAGVCKELGGYAIIVGGYHDHVHLLTRIPSSLAVSDFVGKVKSNTSRHVNATSGLILKFGWQDGFGAFTVSMSQKDKVYRYIENQEEHHGSTTFETEYVSLLRKHEIEFDERYVFD